MTPDSHPAERYYIYICIGTTKVLAYTNLRARVHKGPVRRHNSFVILNKLYFSMTA